MLFLCLVPPQQPQIILLREGTDASQGKAQLVSNINAAVAVADVLKSTLGPRGMDKLIHDDKVRHVSALLTLVLSVRSFTRRIDLLCSVHCVRWRPLALIFDSLWFRIHFEKQGEAMERVGLKRCSRQSVPLSKTACIIFPTKIWRRIS